MLAKCQFTTKYYNYQIGKKIDFNCPEGESLTSGFCIFHDKDYLQDKANYEEHKRKILDRLKNKVNHAISNDEPLLFIGFQLHNFRLSDLSIITEFTKPVYFSGSQFGALVLFGMQTYVTRRLFEGIMGKYLQKINGGGEEEEWLNNDIREIAKENKLADWIVRNIWLINKKGNRRYKGTYVFLILYLGIAFLLWLFIIIL